MNEAENQIPDNTTFTTDLKDKQSTISLIFVSLLLVSSIGFSIYLAWRNQQLETQVKSLSDQFSKQTQIAQTQTQESPVAQLPSMLPNNQQPTLSMVATPTPTSTVSLKTYKNNYQNISFQYPASWTLEDTPGMLDGENIINTRIELSKENSKITIWLNLDGIGGVGKKYSNTSPIKFMGQNFYKYSEADGGNKSVGIIDTLSETLGAFKIQNKTYSIHLDYPESTNNEQEKELLAQFDQILSSFSFIK